jgi:predicted nucleic acid-binding protein
MTAEFCDTNIVVYAYDVTAGTKRDEASLLLGRLWKSGKGVISVQVLQELFVALTKRIPQPLAIQEARSILSDLATWRVIEPGYRDVLNAVDAVDRWHVSFWDAMILTTANRSGAEIVWSEDMNDGQVYDGVVVRNPFSSARSQ